MALSANASCDQFLLVDIGSEAAYIERLRPLDPKGTQFRDLENAFLYCTQGRNQTVATALASVGRIANVYLTKSCSTASVKACLTSADQTRILKVLHSLPQVVSVQYISVADAYKRFKSEFTGNSKLLASTPRDALPASYIVTLQSPSGYAVLDAAVRSLPGVEEVTQTQGV